MDVPALALDILVKLHKQVFHSIEIEPEVGQGIKILAAGDRKIGFVITGFHAKDSLCVEKMAATGTTFCFIPDETEVLAHRINGGYILLESGIYELAGRIICTLDRQKNNGNISLEDYLKELNIALHEYSAHLLRRELQSIKGSELKLRTLDDVKNLLFQSDEEERGFSEIVPFLRRSHELRQRYHLVDSNPSWEEYIDALLTGYLVRGFLSNPEQFANYGFDSVESIVLG